MIIFSPILVMVLVRRTCALIVAMSIPIIAIFLARIHYGSLLLQSKPLPQMGDWAIWLNAFFGLSSLGILFVWVIARTIAWLQAVLSK